MGTLTVISWRDIPAQVIAKRGRDTFKVQLTPRFQEAIDRAAMLAVADLKKSSSSMPPASPSVADVENIDPLTALSRKMARSLNQ